MIGAPGAIARFGEDEVRLMEKAADKMVAVAAMNQTAKALIQFMEFIDAWIQKDEVQLVENPADETGTVADEAGEQVAQESDEIGTVADKAGEQVAQESTGEASTREHEESVTGSGFLAS